MEEVTVVPMLEAVTSAITTVLSWCGTVIQSLLDTGGALAPLLPMFAVGVAISCVMLGCKLIRSFIWGA